MSDKPRAKSKVAKVMHEMREGKLHSGSKHGPLVHNRDQAIAIGMSEERREKHKGKKHKGGKGKRHAEK